MRERFERLSRHGGKLIFRSTREHPTPSNANIPVSSFSPSLYSVDFFFLPVATNLPAFHRTRVLRRHRRVIIKGASVYVSRIPYPLFLTVRLLFFTLPSPRITAPPLRFLFDPAMEVVVPVSFSFVTIRPSFPPPLILKLYFCGKHVPVGSLRFTVATLEC